MLDINLVGLVTGKGRIEAGQHTLFLEAFKLFLIKEVAPGSLFPKEQPIPARCTGRLAFLQIGPKRGKPGTWTHHDDRDTRIFGETESLGNMDEHRDRYILGKAFGKIRGCNAKPVPAMACISH